MMGGSSGVNAKAASASEDRGLRIENGEENVQQRYPRFSILYPRPKNYGS
jgi:hypothetical protein